MMESKRCIRVHVVGTTGPLQGSVTTALDYQQLVPVGPQLSKLLADLKTHSASPEAVRKLDLGLKDLRFVHPGEVSSSVQEIVQVIGDSLEHARAEENYPRFLFNLGKAVTAHPAVLESLRSSTCWQRIQALLHAAAADGRVYSNPVTVSQIVSAQVSLSIYCLTFWQQVPDHCISCWDEQAASNFIYAYGKLYSAGLAPAADERVQSLQTATFIWHAPELAPQGVPKCAWSFAKQGLKSGDVVTLLLEAVMRTASRMDSQGVANTLWAYATMKQPLGAAQEPLMRTLVKVSSQINPENVANTLWAFATMGLPLGAAQEPLMRACVRVSLQMKPQDVVNCLWAFATMGLPLGAVQEPLVRTLVKVSSQMNAQEVANTFWAFATMKQPLGAAQEPLFSALVRVSSQMNAQEVANSCWAFATMGQPPLTAQEPFMSALVRVSSQMNAQEVANTFWAFATLELPLVTVQEPLMSGLVRVSSQMNAQGVAITLWACATMGLPLGAAQEPLMSALVRVSSQMDAQDVAITLWSICRLELQSSSEAERHLCTAVIRLGPHLQPWQVAQARQGLQWMEHHCRDSSLVAEAAAALQMAGA
jgi:hypothetical protein